MASRSEVAPLVTGVPGACFHRCPNRAAAQAEFNDALTAGNVHVV
jgi:hypothetical protein